MLGLGVGKIGQSKGSSVAPAPAGAVMVATITAGEWTGYGPGYIVTGYTQDDFLFGGDPGDYPVGSLDSVTDPAPGHIVCYGESSGYLEIFIIWTGALLASSLLGKTLYVEDVALGVITGNDAYDYAGNTWLYFYWYAEHPPPISAFEVGESYSIRIE